MPTKSLDVLRLDFWKGASANFEGYFIMNSSDTKLAGIKREINEATIELPKYQLTITAENDITYQVIDCWIDKFEFENHGYKHTKCSFLCNDIQQLNTAKG